MIEQTSGYIIRGCIIQNNRSKKENHRQQYTEGAMFCSMTYSLSKTNFNAFAQKAKIHMTNSFHCVIQEKTMI